MNCERSIDVFTQLFLTSDESESSSDDEFVLERSNSYRLLCIFINCLYKLFTLQIRKVELKTTSQM